MSQWWESLETGEEWGDDDDVDVDDEREDDPSTWDLTANRAADEHGTWQSMDSLDRRELLKLVINGVQPDGSDASHDTRAHAARALRTRDHGLWEAILIAFTGKTADGSPVEDWSVKEKAHKRVETARLAREESWKDPLTGEIRFAAGDPRSADERLIVRTPPSTRKASSSHYARVLLEQECVKRGLDFAATVAPLRPGRPSEEERVRRARLAVVVATVRGAGVTLEAIGEAIDQPKQRIHELAKVGEVLLSRLTP